MSTRLHEMDGMFVGSLNAEELVLFEMACARGFARRSYEGAGGLLGLAKVRLIPVRSQIASASSRSRGPETDDRTS